MVNNSYKYVKMDKTNRAKQFMPFDALTGLREALREKERLREVKRELSEEQKAELDYKIRNIEKFDVVTVIYYENEGYKNITGNVEKIDFFNKCLRVNEINIRFDNIFDLQLR